MKTIIKNSVLMFFLFTMVIACEKEKEQITYIRPVRVQKPIPMQEHGNNIIIPASVNELRETKLSFRVGGPLIRLNDVTGCYVKEGDIIAQLDPRDFKIAVEATEARYKLAKAEYERYKNLVEKESVSKSVFDQVETNYDLAKTDFESAKNAYLDTDIKAPFSGYINQVFVNNFEEIGPGTPIVSLLDMSQLEVNAWISLKDVTKINKNATFTCIVKHGDKDIRIPGRLKEIGNKTSISKQSLPITIVINSCDEVKLKAGMATYLEISNAEEQNSVSFKVPVASIFINNGKNWVWVYNEQSGIVTAKHVITGKVMDEGNIEIAKGLSGNEMIVTAGTQYLFDGQKVKKLEEFSKSNVGNKL